MLRGCTVTESNVRGHPTLGIPYTTREVNFKSLVSGTNTIKACTLIYCVVAATGIIFQDLGVQHFGDENVHMLCLL